MWVPGTGSVRIVKIITLETIYNKKVYLTSLIFTTIIIKVSFSFHPHPHTYPHNT